MTELQLIAARARKFRKAGNHSAIAAISMGIITFLSDRMGKSPSQQGTVLVGAIVGIILVGVAEYCYLQSRKLNGQVLEAVDEENSRQPNRLNPTP